MTPEMKRGHVQPQRTQRAPRDTENLYSLCLSVLSVSSVAERAARQPLMFRAARDLGGRCLEAQSSRPPLTQVPRYARDDSKFRAVWNLRSIGRDLSLRSG